jgi:membrane-associated phospholipid phosphatase
VTFRSEPTLEFMAIESARVKSRFPWSIAFIALATFFRADPAGAQTEARPRRIVFDQRFRPFEWPDALQTGLTLGAYAYLEFGIDYPAEARWQKPILFDAAARDALVAETPQGRNTAAVVSDITWYVPMFLPWVESIALPLFTDDWNWYAAWQLNALNAQAVSVVALLTRAGHKFIARERPDVDPCTADPSYDNTCFGGSFASFPSGHSSAAMVGAGLSCAHHTYLPLLGGGTADVAVCVAGSALGVVNGVSRLAADRHYASDVVVGLVLGWGVGFGMPVLLHYEWGRAAPKSAWTIAPWADSEALGLRALGIW